MSKVNLARSFKPKDAFGQPKAYLRTAKADDNGEVIDGQRFVLGAVFGTATGVKIVTRATPSDEVETFYGLNGNFEAVPTDTRLAVTKAPVAFLASHIHDALAPQLKDQGKGQQENVNGADNIGFAFEVSIVTKRSSSAGFIWEYASKSNFATVDPLAELRKLAIEGMSAPALAVTDQSAGAIIPNEPSVAEELERNEELERQAAAEAPAGRKSREKAHA